jgi:ribosomal protein S27AE
MAEAALVCPRCGAGAGPAERFCPDCGMPLTLADRTAGEPADERRERARKVHRPYSEGELVTVATGRNQTEAEFIANLLLEEGVPSLLRRSRGFDVPDMLAAGPRDVLVPRSGEQAAREILLQAELHDRGAHSGPAPAAVLVWLLAGEALVALVVWLGSLLT